jgi:hypothetical protein
MDNQPSRLAGNGNGNGDGAVERTSCANGSLAVSFGSPVDHSCTAMPNGRPMEEIRTPNILCWHHEKQL